MARVCIVRRRVGWFGERRVGWERLGDVRNQEGYQHTLYQMTTTWVNDSMDSIGMEMHIQKFDNYLIVNGSYLMTSEFGWDKIVDGGCGPVIVFLEDDFRRGFG